MILMAVALVALPSMAQSFSSKRSVDNDQQAAQSFSTTEPFRSTSAMQTSGSVYSANPTLNDDGTAYNPVAAAENTSSAKAGRGVRKDGLPSTPNTEGQQDNTPIGDAVLPLMLMALAYLGVRVFSRRKRALNG